MEENLNNLAHTSSRQKLQEVKNDEYAAAISARNSNGYNVKERDTDKYETRCRNDTEEPQVSNYPNQRVPVHEPKIISSEQADVYHEEHEKSTRSLNNQSSNYRDRSLEEN